MQARELTWYTHAVVTTLRRKQNGGIDLRGGLGPKLVTGAEAAQSQLISRFRTQVGEWVFNLIYGVDYDALMGKFFDETATAALFADTASAPSAVSVVPSGSVGFSLDPETRKQTVTISPVFPISGESFDFVVPTLESAS